MPHLALPVFLALAVLAAERPVTGARTCAVQPLLGTWKADTLTFDGKPQADEEMLGARFTFTKDRLRIETAKAPLAFAISVDAGSAPCALHLDPLEGSREPEGWMLFEVHGSGLRLGFHDNLSRRPASFEARPEMLVLRLSRS